MGMNRCGPPATTACSRSAPQTGDAPSLYKWGTWLVAHAPQTGDAPSLYKWGTCWIAHAPSRGDEPALYSWVTCHVRSRPGLDRGCISLVVLGDRRSLPTTLPCPRSCGSTVVRRWFRPRARLARSETTASGCPAPGMERLRTSHFPPPRGWRRLPALTRRRATTGPGARPGMKPAPTRRGPPWISPPRSPRRGDEALKADRVPSSPRRPGNGDGLSPGRRHQRFTPWAGATSCPMLISVERTVHPHAGGVDEAVSDPLACHYAPSLCGAGSARDDRLRRHAGFIPTRVGRT